MKLPFVDLKAQYDSIKNEIDQTIYNVIQDSAFIGGKYLKTFEQNYANYIGTKHCIGVGNGTDALFIVLKCLGIKEGDEVITVANSFIATSESITTSGAKVVFVDCDEKTYNIDVQKIEKVITKKRGQLFPFIYTDYLPIWIRCWKLPINITCMLLKMQPRLMDLNIKIRALVLLVIVLVSAFFLERILVLMVMQGL